MLSFLILGILLVSGSFAKTAPHIVGGKDADNGEWPWQLALYANNQFNCGASIIGSTWGITAAHCVGGTLSGYSIMAGSNNVGDACNSGECFKRSLTKAVLHPDYSSNSTMGFPNDIAVISWEEPIPESTGKVNVKYVPRATDTNQVGKNCYITGWGRLRGFGPLPTMLQEADIDVLTTKECEQRWDENSISDKHVCVTDKETQAKGSCNGDSGGPLVCEVAPNKWELVGATSWGLFGCSTTRPSVYTRISSYNTWIDSVINPE